MATNNTQSLREDEFDKDIEVQSLHLSSTEVETEEKRDALTGKDDIEAYPVVDETQDEEQKQKDGAVTRTSTKSSWKDPGPPPDGGKEAWIQGSFTPPKAHPHSSSQHIFLCSKADMVRTAAMGHLAVMNTWGFVNSFGVGVGENLFPILACRMIFS
jgi:hypothetical protein